MEGVTQPPALRHPNIADHPDPTSTQMGPCQTLVMEARQLGDFCSFSLNLFVQRSHERAMYGLR